MQSQVSQPTLKEPQVGQTTNYSLRKRPRIRETLIQAFLFLCGALSILITIGIVYELGKESLLFFNRQQWENTNKGLAEDIDANQTSFVVNNRVAKLVAGDTVRINQEIMQMLSIEGALVSVE